jgi:hypothetical protein
VIRTDQGVVSQRRLDCAVLCRRELDFASLTTLNGTLEMMKESNLRKDPLDSTYFTGLTGPSKVCSFAGKNGPMSARSFQGSKSDAMYTSDAVVVDSLIAFLTSASVLALGRTAHCINHGRYAEPSQGFPPAPRVACETRETKDTFDRNSLENSLHDAFQPKATTSTNSHKINDTIVVVVFRHQTYL